jgi:NAD(P)-dependent dehydrogenase (short-subunit alcohol dehydrogenase family)
MTKTVLITGGNSGIGYAAAQLFRDKGYSVTIVGRDVEKVEGAATELDINAFVADMANIDDIKRLGEHFYEMGLDALVNNAAICQVSPIGTYSEEQFERHFQTNVRGPLFLTQELLPALEKRQGGVTFVSSIITVHGAAGAGLYAASKGAIEGATRTLALELAPKKIRVNVVSPGAVDTPMFTKMGLTDEQQQMLVDQHIANIPLKRFAEPAEVAEVIHAQIESSYVTGSIWTVDGGVDA